METPPPNGRSAAQGPGTLRVVTHGGWVFSSADRAVAEGRLAVTVAYGERLGRYPVQRGGVGLLEFGGTGLSCLLGHGHLALERLDVALVALHFGLDAGHGFLVFLQRAPQPGLALCRTRQ
jgi:hypothetical protein